MPMVGALTGSLVIGIPMQLYGRRRTLIGLYSFFIVGFFLIYLTIFGQHKAMIYVGRFLTGFGAGSATPTSQIYVIII